MSLGSRLLLLLSVLGLVVGGLSAAAHAATPTEVTLDARSAFAGQETTLRLRLAAKGGAPVAGAEVAIERRTDGTWAPVSVVTTDGEGQATERVTLARKPGNNSFRATFAGDNTYEPAARQAKLDLKRRESKVRISGPRDVKDGRSVPVTVRWNTAGGAPVAGPVKVYRSLGGGKWHVARVVKTGDDGRAKFRTTPRRDSRWRAVAIRQAWVEGDRSGVHRIDNLPPGIARPAAQGRAEPAPEAPAAGTPSAQGPARQDHRDPGPDLVADDRDLLAPRLPGRPVRAAAGAGQLLGLRRVPRAAVS